MLLLLLTIIMLYYVVPMDCAVAAIIINLSATAIDTYPEKYS